MSKNDDGFYFIFSEANDMLSQIINRCHQSDKHFFHKHMVSICLLKYKRFANITKWCAL